MWQETKVIIPQISEYPLTCWKCMTSMVDNFDTGSVESGTISVLSVGSSNFKKNFLALRISVCNDSLQRLVNSAKPAPRLCLFINSRLKETVVLQEPDPPNFFIVLWGDFI